MWLREGVCTEDLYINIENITEIRQNLECKMDETNCKVCFIIQSFDLVENGVVNIKLSELRVYVQEFLLK
jgi:hypothetical protein